MTFRAQSSLLQDIPLRKMALFRITALKLQNSVRMMDDCHFVIVTADQNFGIMDNESC